MGDIIHLPIRGKDASDTLRQARRRGGWSQATFARLLGQIIGRPELSTGTVRAWEAGTLTPPARILDAARALGTRPMKTPSFPPVAVTQDEPRAPATSTAWMPREPTLTDGHDVHAAMEAFRTADRQVGGGYVYGAVLRYLETHVGPRLFATTDGPASFAGAAALTEMAGWMAHDGGNDHVAHQHFRRALQFAQATDDTELTAHIYASLSHLAHPLGQTDEALALARAGQETLNRKPLHPALAARLHAMEARALGLLGREADCGRALMAAEQALDNIPAKAPSPWVSPFDHASLAAEASQCMEQLGKLDAARRHSEDVIRLRGGDRARSRAFGQLRLARILTAQGEIEQACKVTTEALAGTGGLSSNRVVQLLRSIHSRLLPHRSTADVGTILEPLTAALSQRAHLHLLIGPPPTQGPVHGT